MRSAVVFLVLAVTVGLACTRGDGLPTAQIPKRTGPIVIDGVLDEPDWSRAARLPFSSSDGKQRKVSFTEARILWDPETLWLAFQAKDPDVFTPYSRRDDPLYDSEAFEIFIDADGDKDAYVELQASANDSHFDASFRGGSRKNMDRSFDAEFITKAAVQGTLNEPNDVDDGLVSEWRIPVSELEDIPAGEPRAGATWKINLFRLERIRRGGKVVGTEGSAWSPPIVGDFHKLDRFGAITFE